MDNKLSELSKPVAEVVSKFGDLEAFGEREIKLLTGIQQVAYGTKFYSQEYVSALLAELEKAQCANNSAPTILRQLAEEKQKRGEVAAATAFNYAASALQKELSK